MSQIDMISVGKLFEIEKGTLQSLKNIPGQYVFLTGSEDWKTHKEYSHDCEALVFVMGASGSLGRVHYVKGKFIASDLCFILTPRKEFLNKIDLGFYKIYLNMIRKEIVRELGTGTSKIAINRTSFSNYLVPYLEVSLQNAIKEKIVLLKSKLDKFFSINKENEDYISKLRQQILQEAVQGKLVPQDPNDEPASKLLEKIQKERENLIKEGKIKKQGPLPPITDEEKPYDLPRGWEWVRLGDIANYGHLEKIESKKISKDTWLLDLEDIEKTTSRLITRKKFGEVLSKSTKNIFQRGDVLYGKLRPYLDKVLVAEIFGVCTTEIVPIRPYLINSYYLKWFLKNPSFINRINSLTYGVKMPRLGTADAEKTLVSLPPLSEQKRIVEKVDKLMSYCDELEKQVKETQANSEKLMETVLKESFSN